MAGKVLTLSRRHSETSVGTGAGKYGYSHEEGSLAMYSEPIAKPAKTCVLEELRLTRDR